MRVAALFVVSGLLVAACGGGSDSAETVVTTAPPATTPETAPPATDGPTPETTQPPSTEPPSTEPPVLDDVTVSSPDGDLAISVAGAEHDSVGPTVGILDPAEWPPELTGAGTSDGVTVYDLQPSGATFEQPVVVTRRLDAANFPELGPFDLPLVTLLTYSDGVYELLDGHTALRVGDDIDVSGTTSHFSGLIAVRGFPEIHLNDNLTISGFLDASFQNLEDPEDVTFDLDQADLDLILSSGDPLEGLDMGFAPDSAFDSFDEPVYTHEGSKTVAQSAQRLNAYNDEFGIGLALTTTTFEVPFSASPSAAQLLGEAIDAEVDTFEYQTALFLATVPDELYDDALDLVDEMLDDLDADIELIAEVFHQEFGTYPSSIRRSFSGLTIRPGLRAYSGLFDGDLDDPRLVSLAPLREVDGALVAESGIECFCDYGEMLFFLGADDADSVEALMNLPDGAVGSDEFWQFVRDHPDSVAARVVEQADADTVMTLAVGPAEGEVANTPVDLEPWP